MKHVNCDLCGADDYSLLHEIDVSEKNLTFYRYSRNIASPSEMTGTFNLVRCKQCSFIYVNPTFSGPELEMVYSSNKIIGSKWRNFDYLFKKDLPDELQSDVTTKANTSSVNNWKFDIINSYMKDNKGRKLLDIGCGNGKFVFDALNLGYDAHGIDLSPDRIQEGQKLYDLDGRIRQLNVDDFETDEVYDIITLWDVIEHVESPSKMLESIKKISHENTLVFALTMSVDSITYKLFKKNWKYVNPTQHLSYFSHSTMKAMYEKNGYEFIAAEMDSSRDKNFIHLTYYILMGLINRFFFKLYASDSFVRKIFKALFHRSISLDRMKKRIENIYPVVYIGRYHDNFVFIGKKKV